MSVPELGFLQKMNPEQEGFYRELVDSIENKTYLPVGGQEVYLNYYIREQYKTFDNDALKQLYDELLCLTVPYGEGKVGKGIFWRPESWSYDCLLALESYDKYFEVTKPAKIFSTSTHFANQKCNVRYFLGMPANAVEFLQIYGGLRNSITNFTMQYPKEYKRILEALFAEEEQKSGSWFERILAESDRKDYQNKLFQCLHFARRSKIPNFCFYGASENLTKQICDVFREAENRLRQKFGEKNVGEQWDDETKWFYEIKNAFPDTEVIHHGKPEWLGKQHLDIWMPEFRIGIEYHGVQHFQPMKHLGGEEKFSTQQERDLRKSDLCKLNGVELIVVTEETQIETVMEKIKTIMTNPF
jgi:hypothetical protein